MIKRLLLILIALIPFTVFSQKTVGDWKVYSRFANITQLVQTPDKLYFLSGNTLYSNNKENNETYIYTSFNKLNDSKVSKIYYNKVGKYLVITYETGNIDILYDNGNVENIPYLKDAILNISPTINDVTFKDNNIYFATKFGLMIYDVANHKVEQTVDYGKEILLITCVGDHIVVDENHNLYFIHKDDNFDVFDNFKQILSGWWITDIEGINDSKIIYKGTNKNIYIVEFNFNENKCNRVDVDVTTTASDLIYGLNAIYYVSNNVVYSISSEGEKKTHSTLPSELSSQLISIWDNPDDVWGGDKNGIANYKIANGELTVLQEKIKPTSYSVDNSFFITSNVNGKVFVSNHGESRYISKFKGNSWWYSYINTIDGDKIEDITPSGLESVNGASPNFQRKDGKPYTSYNLVFDPEDPETYYLSTYFDGIYKIKDGKQVAHYHEGNSSLLAIYGCRVFGVAFDKENNLWCVNEVNANKGSPALHILPAEARKKETTTEEDWIPINLNPFIGSRDVRILMCEKSNMVFICDGIWSGPIVAYDTKGTYSDVSDDEFYLWDSFTDQDGKSFDPDQISALNEDKNGRVWIGTTNGIIEITDPSKAINSDMRVNRLKTKDGDYLFEGIHVSSISTDDNNNKWVGTFTNGVYYVDANGENIFDRFTSENSSLPSDIVYNVYVNPTTKSTFIGSSLGLVEYNGYSSVANDDYDNVYVYPNPVTPDYTGWITIKGLMSNSKIKITDISGNVFYTTTSIGGIVTWDGCNASGERIKSGVYLVYASQEGNNPEIVAKIMVVN